jgi:hypothetical protein
MPTVYNEVPCGFSTAEPADRTDDRRSVWSEKLVLGDIIITPIQVRRPFNRRQTANPV